MNYQRCKGLVTLNNHDMIVQKYEQQLHTKCIYVHVQCHDMIMQKYKK